MSALQAQPTLEEENITELVPEARNYCLRTYSGENLADTSLTLIHSRGFRRTTTFPNLFNIEYEPSLLKKLDYNTEMILMGIFSIYET